MNDKKKKVEEIEIKFPPELQKGVYANLMYVTHTKEEFIMDFIMAAPPVGTVTARVITSPGHVKRIIKALQDNVDRYEKKYGKIEVAEEPKVSITKH